MTKSIITIIIVVIALFFLVVKCLIPAYFGPTIISQNIQKPDPNKELIEKLGAVEWKYVNAHAEKSMAESRIYFSDSNTASVKEILRRNVPIAKSASIKMQYALVEISKLRKKIPDSILHTLNDSELETIRFADKLISESK